MASDLDYAQIIKRLYNEQTNQLETNATVTGEITIESAQEVVITHTDDSIKIGDGSRFASVTTSNALKVDNSAVTQPVSGTVAATQSGTWNVTNISGTVSLPTGAATEATLNAQSSFDHGSKGSIGLTALQLTASSITAKKGVLVKASAANTGIIYVGNSDVTANSTEATDGYELYAGEAVLIEVDNANKIYVIASATGQKVFFTVS